MKLATLGLINPDTRITVTVRRFFPEILAQGTMSGIGHTLVYTPRGRGVTSYGYADRQ